MYISLAKFNGTGTHAAIEDKDGHACCLVEDESQSNPQVACNRAAAELRLLADRFDELAKLEDPFKATTQRKLNRKKGKR